jgi:polyisoprenoid-binding protein YceI
MDIRKRLYWSVLAGFLLVFPGPGVGEDDDLCLPFLNGKVNESLVAKMLSAAEDGNLYRIEPSSSRVGFCVDSQFARVEGDFREFQGGLALTPEENINGQAMVLVKTDSLDAKGALIESIIKSERFFDVRTYPEILFVSSGFRWLSATSAVLEGNLTLHGVTRPVVFNVEITNLDDSRVDVANSMLVKATTTIRRSDFGMDTLSRLVSDTVQLCMSVEARKYVS